MYQKNHNKLQQWYASLTAKAKDEYFSVAVAVRPTKGTSSKTSRNLSKCLYSTLKSCPHSDMQWASSTAKRLIPAFSKLDQKLQKYDES